MGASNEARTSYWLTPVRSDHEWSAEKVVTNYVEQAHIYAFSDKTRSVKRIIRGDWILFYATGEGVVAHARIINSPQRRPDPRIRNPKMYPWIIELDDVLVYLDNPVVINASLRSTLDAFNKKDPKKPWAWLVQTTRALSEHDFNKLTLSK
jgi:hypothetical protein